MNDVRRVNEEVTLSSRDGVRLELCNADVTRRTHHAVLELRFIVSRLRLVRDVTHVVASPVVVLKGNVL